MTEDKGHTKTENQKGLDTNKQIKLSPQQVTYNRRRVAYDNGKVQYDMG